MATVQELQQELTELLSEIRVKILIFTAKIPDRIEPASPDDREKLFSMYENARLVYETAECAANKLQPKSIESTMVH